MRVSLFYQIQVPKPWTASSKSERIHEALEQIPFAEEQGFSSVWFSEHHFRPVWSHNSAPDLTLAAVSQRTSSIRLGIGVVLAPIHHPLHVAARMATLDILSHGRVDVGLAAPVILTSLLRMERTWVTREACGWSLPTCCRHLGAGDCFISRKVLFRFRLARFCQSPCSVRTLHCGLRAAAMRRRA